VKCTGSFGLFKILTYERYESGCLVCLFLLGTGKQTDRLSSQVWKNLYIKYVKPECHRKVKLTVGAGNIFVEIFLPLSNIVERAKMSVAINISNEPFMNEKVNPVNPVFIF